MEPGAGHWAASDDLPKLALLLPDLVRTGRGRLQVPQLASGLHAQAAAVVSCSLLLCTAATAGVSCQPNICITVLITSLSVLSDRSEKPCSCLSLWLSACVASACRQGISARCARPTSPCILSHYLPNLPCLQVLLSSGRARARAGACGRACGTARGGCGACRGREASRTCRGRRRARRGAAQQGLQQVHAAGSACGAGLCRTCTTHPCLSMRSSS
jgi:hypothetical protein